MRASIPVTLCIGAMLLGACVAQPGTSRTAEATPETKPQASPTSGAGSPTPAATSSPTVRPAFPDETIFFIGREAVTFDGRNRLTIPASEFPRMASGPFVLTTEFTTSRTSTLLRLYDIRTGAQVLEVEQTGLVTQAVVTEDDLYVAAPVANDPTGNAALVRFGIADGGAEVVSEALPGPERWQRGLLVRSPSGATVATQIEQVDASFQRIGDGTVEVVAIATGARRSLTVGDSNLTALSDDIVYTRNERLFRGYSIDTGEMLWQHDVDGTLWPHILSDGSLVQPYLSESEKSWLVGIPDPVTGEIRRKFRLPDSDLPVLHSSTDRYLVFTSSDGNDPRRYEYLDLETGEYGSDSIPESAS